MDNKTNNLQTIIKIAHALGKLNDEVVYVGGSVVDLYVNDPGAEKIRPTKDIDILTEIVSFGKLEEFRQKLINRGFSQSLEDDVTCRFRYDDLIVDVMSTKIVGWAPSNRWFELGFSDVNKIKVNNIDIRILSLPYYLASKFSAFQDRGISDPLISYDLEDIVYVLNNRTDLVENITNSPHEVLIFLREQFQKILKLDILQEAVLGNLEFSYQSERFQMLLQKLRLIVNFSR